jgi:NADH-quinone oxidoreductase subunit A
MLNDLIDILKNIIVSPLLVFVIFLLIAYAIYRFGGLLSPKTKIISGKLKAYACGEDIPGRFVQPTYHVFYIAFFFTILHVSVLVVATIPKGSIAVVGVFYLLMLLVSIYVLMRR